MKKALILVGLLAIVLPGGLVLADVAFESTRVTTHTFAGPIDEIVVRSDRGDVELVRARGSGVEVRETQHYVLREPTLERDVDNGILTLEARCKASFVTCFSELRVSVPAGATVRVDSDSGDIEARRVDVADAQLRSDSGDMRLELRGRRPAVRARADSGDIEITARGARAIDVQTDSGDVRVTVPQGEYAGSTNTDSGDVKVEGIVRNDRAARSIEAHTDSGDVTLTGG